MRRGEFAVALGCALVTGAALLYPVWSGYQAAGQDDRVFLGMIRSDDFHRYASFMDQARLEGRFAFLDRSAVEPQDGRILAVFFWVLGLVGRWSGIEPVHLYQAMTPISALLLLAALWPWVGRLSQRRSTRVAAWLLLYLGCGVEHLAGLSGLEVPRLRNSWMDGFSLFTLHHNPLKVTALALLSVLLLLGSRYLEEGRRRDLALLVPAVPLLWLLHPNTAITAYFALVALALMVWCRAGRSGALRPILVLSSMAPGAALVLLQILWMKGDPVVAHVITCYQVPGLAEPLALFPIRYGLLLPLGLLGLWVATRERRGMDLPLAAWFTAALVTARLPALTGLLFSHALYPVLALLAARGLDRLWSGSPGKGHRLAWSLLGLTLTASLVGDGAALRQMSRQTREDVWPTSLYLSTHEWQAAHHLRSLPEGSVLATRDAGMKLAWLAARPALLGHWGTTPHRRIKEAALAEFLEPGRPLEQKRAILERSGIRFVFHGPREARIGPLDPGLGLIPVGRFGPVTLWENPDWQPGRVAPLSAAPARRGTLKLP